MKISSPFRSMIQYPLLPSMYTLFYHAHTKGATAMRALQWGYPHDQALAGAERQFSWRPAVLVTLVLEQGAISMDGVFPGSGGGRAGEGILRSVQPNSHLDILPRSKPSPSLPHRHKSLCRSLGDTSSHHKNQPSQQGT